MAIIGKVAAQVYQLGLGADGALNSVLLKERYAALSKQEEVVLDEDEIYDCKSRISRTTSRVFFGWAVAVSALNAGFAYNNPDSPVAYFNAGTAIFLLSMAAISFKDDSRKSLVEDLNGSKGALSADGEARREDLLKKGRWNWSDVDRVDAVLLVEIISKKVMDLKQDAFEEKLSSFKNRLDAQAAKLFEEPATDFSPSKPRSPR